MCFESSLVLHFLGRLCFIREPWFAFSSCCKVSLSARGQLCAECASMRFGVYTGSLGFVILLVGCLIRKLVNFVSLVFVSDRSMKDKVRGDLWNAVGNALLFYSNSSLSFF